MRQHKLLAVLLAGTMPLSGAAQELPSSADVNRIEPFTPSLLDTTQSKTVAIPDVAPDVSIPDQASAIRFVLDDLMLEGISAFDKDTIIKQFASNDIGQEVGLDRVYIIASEITSHYRKHGYFLSRAYVPAQSIENGQVTIAVTEGYIADIELESDEETSRIIARYQQRLLALKPIKAQELESFMLSLNALPGQEFTALIRPYPEHNDAVKLVLQQSDEPASAAITLDNYGSRFLGPYQSSLRYSDSWLPLQQTSLSMLSSVPLDELQFFGITHEIPVYPDWTISLSANYMTSEPGSTLASNQIESDSVQWSLGMRYQPIRQRDENLLFGAELDVRNSNGDILENNPLTRDRIRTLRLRSDYDVSDKWNGKNYFNAQLNKGLGILGASDEGDVNLSRAEGNPEALSLQINAIRQQMITQDWLGVAQLSGQIASDPLLSVEEFGVGGQRFGLAYDPSEITGDHGLAVSLELRYISVPSWENIRITPYGFYDHGAVWNEDTGAERESASSVGGGIYLSHTSGISVTLGLAFPLTRDVQNPLYGHNKNPRLLMQIGYQF
ncbi:MAG: ShlB/FhaC/HecB family hemolysin secretion/activation protein [Sphaerospermopsis sp. SIO1G2]|nr:ShlB/FhaC/HecB family hemolysin secretion/activation protein [Sphaerospermopsis sp. SIO1G2]